MTAALLEREPLYASVADHVVDTDAAAPDETAARLVELAAGRDGVRDRAADHSPMTHATVTRMLVGGFLLPE